MMATSGPGIDYYQVHEMFQSVQGEGMHSGELATFIRLQGCTVGCSWCDSGPLSAKGDTNGQTGNTWGRGGQRMLTADIMAQVRTKYVVITGGEPLLWNLDGLLDQLQPKHYVSIETSGRPGFKGVYRPDWITWSPKPNLLFDADPEVKLWADEVKWVIDDKITWEVLWETWSWYMEAPDNQKQRFSHRHKKWQSVPWFVLMPEGCPPGPVTIKKAMELLGRVPFRAQDRWLFGDRLQYRIGVR